MMTKTERARFNRARVLEAAITRTLKKFGAKLKLGDYMKDVGKPGTCVCAIGAAVLARVPEYFGAGAAKDLQEQLYSHFGVTPSQLNTEESCHIPMGREPRRRMSEWAAQVVNDGITQEDLLQLEEGFEGAQSSTARAEPLVEGDKTSPFWKLGRKLGLRALPAD